MALDLKALALSVNKFLGQPNLLGILSLMKLMISLSVAFSVGMASTHFVKKSVAVSIHLCYPEEVGLISPIKSRPHCWKGAFTTMGFKGKDTSFCFPTNF